MESHTEWHNSYSVGGGGSIGVASSGIFKSTDSWRRSSINYYFRLFKLREDKKVGGTQKREWDRQRERAEPATLFLNFLSAISNPNGKASTFLFLLSVPHDAKTSTSAEQREPDSLLLLISPDIRAKTEKQKNDTSIWALHPGSHGSFRWHVGDPVNTDMPMKPDANCSVSEWMFTAFSLAAVQERTMLPATASARVIPVVATLLWQQAWERKRDCIYF